MRLIDADKLKAIYGMGDDCKDCKRNSWSCRWNAIYTMMDFCGLLDEAPTVDAVPVVRCGECRYWDRYPSCSATPQYHACKRRIFATNVHTMRDDFCSQGERKDGDEHEADRC